MSNEKGSLYGDWFNENWHVWKEADGGIYAEMPAANLEVYECYAIGLFKWRAYSVSIHRHEFYGVTRTTHRNAPLAESVLEYKNVEEAKREAVFWYVYGTIGSNSNVVISSEELAKMTKGFDEGRTIGGVMAGATARMIYDSNAVEPIPAEAVESTPA